MCSKEPMWLQEAAVFTFLLMTSLFVSYSTWPLYTNVHHSNHICWHIEFRNWRFTQWVAYQNIVTFLKFCQHKSKSIAILGSSRWLNVQKWHKSQLRHCGCIGRHRDYCRLLRHSEPYNNNTFYTYVYFNTYFINAISNLY